MASPRKRWPATRTTLCPWVRSWCSWCSSPRTIASNGLTCSYICVTGCNGNDMEDDILGYFRHPNLKSFLLAQLAQHCEADRLIKGDYWVDGKGCAVGCTIEALRHFNGHGGRIQSHRDHGLYETELGIPRILARLEDRFFEVLDNGRSQAWPERFSSAVRVGADLAMVWPRFALWLLTDEVPQH